MKKKILTMVMALALTMSATGMSFASTNSSFSCKINLSDLYAFLTNYICNNGGQAGGQDTVVPELPQLPEQDNTVTDSSKAGQILSLVNKERASAGLSSLKADSQLNKVAQLKAEDMAKNGYFSHTSPTYGSPFDMLKQHGVSYKTAGENIAKGQKTSESVMKGWMNSSGHRANILNSSYSRLGVGYAVDASGTPYWVQIFAG